MKRILILIVCVCSAFVAQAEETERSSNNLPLAADTPALATDETSSPEMASAELIQDSDALDRAYSAVYKLPGWLQQVTKACAWQSKSQDNFWGYVRIALGQLPDGDRVYVQWIQKVSEVGPHAVISTREIEELRGAHLRLKGIQAEIRNQHCAVTSAAAEFDQRRHYQININVFEPGRYEFEKTTHLGVGAQ